jgi:4'-phosphopantetheinyl transferase
MHRWSEQDSWPALCPGEVHLWHCDLEACAAPDGCQREYEALLDANERARVLRLRFAADRAQLIASHALLRSVLGVYMQCAPATLRLEREERGKPFLAVGESPPSFNLSHAGTHAVLAVTACAAEIGVDTERHRSGRRFEALARRHFASVEVAQFAALPEAGRLACFYDLWTLKEAYVKARGMGLALPLDGFWFLPGSDDGRLEFAARTDVDVAPARWSFWSYREPAGYSIALALRADAAHSTPLHFDVVPLQRWQRRAWQPQFSTLAR